MIGTADSIINQGWYCWHCKQYNRANADQCATCSIYKNSSAPRLSLYSSYCPVLRAWDTPEEDDAWAYLAEDAAENALIVASGILPKLIEQARQQAPSGNWVEELNNL